MRKISIKSLEIISVLVAINMKEIQLQLYENTLKHHKISVGLCKPLLLKAFREGFPATSLRQSCVAEIFSFYCCLVFRAIAELGRRLVQFRVGRVELRGPRAGTQSILQILQAP